MQSEETNVSKLSVFHVKKMREKYNALSSYKKNKNNSLTDEQLKAKAEEERRLIDRVIESMDERIGRFDESSQRDKHNSLTIILKEVAKIKGFTWSNEQIDKIRNDISEEVKSIIFRTCKWKYRYRRSKIDYTARDRKKNSIK